MRFKVKMDFWISIVFYVTMAVFIIIPVFVIPEVDQSEQIVVYAAIGISLLLIMPIPLASVYALKEEYLYIRLGYIFKKIRYEHIREINETKKIPNNNFALSSDAVEIIVDKGLMRRVVVSPREKIAFMAELRNRCNHLEGKNIEEDFNW